MIDKINEFIAKPIPQQILYFHEMLTPSIIRLAYWLLLVAVLWTGLDHMFSGGFGKFLEGIVMIVGGGLLARVAAEIVMLFFQMHDNLETIAKNTAAPAAAKKKVTKKATKKVSKKA